MVGCHFFVIQGLGFRVVSQSYGPFVGAPNMWNEWKTGKWKPGVHTEVLGMIKQKLGGGWGGFLWVS